MKDLLLIGHNIWYISSNLLRRWWFVYFYSYWAVKYDQSSWHKRTFISWSGYLYSSHWQALTYLWFSIRYCVYYSYATPVCRLHWPNHFGYTIPDFTMYERRNYLWNSLEQTWVLIKIITNTVSKGILVAQKEMMFLYYQIQIYASNSNNSKSYQGAVFFVHRKAIAYKSEKLMSIT